MLKPTIKMPNPFATSPLASEPLRVVKHGLALGSLLWGVLLAWPGDTFGRPTYTIMAAGFSETTWAVMFLLQGAATLWDVYTRGRMPFAALFLTNLAGCALWTGSCVAMLFSVYPPPAAIAMECIAAYQSWWVFARTLADWKNNK